MEPFHVIHAENLEAARSSFWVRFHQRAFRPAGYPAVIPARNRLAEVLAETPAGALRIAEYHHGRLGSSFRLDTRPVAAYNRPSHTVAFCDPRSQCLTNTQEG